MNKNFKFKQYQRVALVSVGSNLPLKIGRITGQSGESVFLKTEPSITRDGWDLAPVTAAPIEDAVIIGEATYEHIRGEVTDELERAQNLELRPPEERPLTIFPEAPVPVEYDDGTKTYTVKHVRDDGDHIVEVFHETQG